MKVLAYCADDTGIAWYRMRRPMSEMVRQGLVDLQSTSDMTPQAYLPRNDSKQEAARCEGISVAYREQSEWADVLHTKHTVSAEFMALFSGLAIVNGLPWILDLDDDCFHLPVVNPAYNTYREKEDGEIFDERVLAPGEAPEAHELEMRDKRDGQRFAVAQKGRDGHNVVMRQIMDADALFVSTKVLAHLYGTVRRDMHPRDHIYILPNSLTPSVWNAVEPPPDHGDEIWIGWAGSTSHIADVNFLADVIDGVLKAHPKTRFFWTKLPNPAFLSLAAKWKQRAVMLEGWAGIRDWAEYYTALNFDIALAPLMDTEFNSAKSNLKWLEAGIMKQPCVCSRIAPYEDSVRNRQDGFLCSRPKQWAKALDALVRSKSMREDVGAAAYERVMADFNMEKNARLWRDAYQDVLSKLGDKCAERARKVRETHELPASA